MPDLFIMNNKSEQFWIPTTLDAPALFFMWEADGAILVLTVFFLFMTMGLPILGLAATIILGRSYAFLKEEGGRGLIVKLLYWFTPSEWWMSKRFASCNRLYIG